MKFPMIGLLIYFHKNCTQKKKWPKNILLKVKYTFIP